MELATVKKWMSYLYFPSGMSPLYSQRMIIKWMSPLFSGKMDIPQWN